jgi:preprotein translocase subunit Sss1
MVFRRGCLSKILAVKKKPHKKEFFMKKNRILVLAMALVLLFGVVGMVFAASWEVVVNVPGTGQVTYYIEANTEAAAKEEARIRVMREYKTPVTTSMMKVTKR